MPFRPPSISLLRRAACLTALGAVTAAGLAHAQPAPQIQVVTPETARSGPAEQAPPINVPTPAPVAVPPMTAKEVAPASPPADAKPAGVPVRRARYDVAVI